MYIVRFLQGGIIKFLEVIYIDSDNRVNVVYDEAFMFQFISK